MVLDRSHLHFTRSTVVDSETVPWDIPTLKIAPKHYVKIKEDTDDPFYLNCNLAK